jgi:acyl dehydratase
MVARASWHWLKSSFRRFAVRAARGWGRRSVFWLGIKRGTVMALDGLTLANIQAFIGCELGVSEWQTLDQRRIDQFAECTGDHQWIHVDRERAGRESPFGTTIAHGYLTLSLLAQTTNEIVVEPLGLSHALNYGLDRTRFLAPVKAGSRVRNRIKLISAESKGEGRTLLTTENQVEIEGELRPALVAHALVMAITE